ncbi:hypothetical protein TYRP_009030 [Tyrophagus putrescentiae]|nr:hypothetical protein TYRP_009030 [Tyrophagus putrescentiae]
MEAVQGTVHGLRTRQMKTSLSWGKPVLTSDDLGMLERLKRAVGSQGRLMPSHLRNLQRRPSAKLIATNLLLEVVQAVVEGQCPVLGHLLNDTGKKRSSGHVLDALRIIALAEVDQDGHQGQLARVEEDLEEGPLAAGGNGRQLGVAAQRGDLPEGHLVVALLARVLHYRHEEGRWNGREVETGGPRPGQGDADVQEDLIGIQLQLARIEQHLEDGPFATAGNVQ